MAAVDVWLVVTNPVRDGAGNEVPGQYRFDAGQAFRPVEPNNPPVNMTYDPGPEGQVRKQPGSEDQS